MVLAQEIECVMLDVCRSTVMVDFFNLEERCG